jgi:hypothetical protein
MKTPAGACSSATRLHQPPLAPGRTRPSLTNRHPLCSTPHGRQIDLSDATLSRLQQKADALKDLKASGYARAGGPLGFSWVGLRGMRARAGRA